jgi:hypothetical protein
MLVENIWKSIMYKLSVITAVNPNILGSQTNIDNSPLVLNDNLVIFCANESINSLTEVRRKYDANLSKTHFIAYDDHNTDSWHLYSQNLQKANIKDLYRELLKLNRFAFIRDYFSKNFFKSTHALWVDWESEFLAGMENKTVKNLEICNESQTLFGDENGELIPDLFVVPQEMAWNFYYLNKLEHREAIYAGNFKSQKEFFVILLGKYNTQINLCYNIPNIVEKLTTEKEAIVPQPKHAREKMHVVVNHFQHDTSWISRLHYNFSVYNKNPNEHHLYNLNLPNVGFDSIVYFTYIIDNYDNLPEYVAFLQDDPFFHCMDVIQIINNFNFDRDFVPMGTSYYLGGHDWKMSEDYAEKVGLPFKRPLKMITSCQSIIKRELILKRPKEFYQLLVSTIDKTVKCSDNYAIENLWPTIFSFNEELVPCLNCKGHGDKQ